MPVDLSTERLAEIAAAAKAASDATGGKPWLRHSYEGQSSTGKHLESVCAETSENVNHQCLGEMEHEDEDGVRALADFVATADPPTVLAMVEEIGRLRSELSKAVEILEPIGARAKLYGEHAFVPSRLMQAAEKFVAGVKP